MAKGLFVTAINCMDGRVQEPVSGWMKERFGADYVDMITEPGPDGILARGEPGQVESIRKRVDISVNGHGSRVVAVVGHYDCAGNPGPKEQHLEQIEKSVERIKSWGQPVRVLGLWVNENRQVELVYDSEKD